MSVNPAELAHEEQGLLDDLAALQEEREHRSAEPVEEPLPPRVYGMIAFMSTLAIGLIMTTVAEVDLIYYLVCFSIDVPQTECLRNPDSGKLVTSFVMYASFISGLLSLVVNPVLSTWSDKIGRRSVLLYSATALLCSRFIEYFLLFGMDSPASYWWLLVANVLVGVAGGIGILLSMSTSYISDLVSEPKLRSRALSLVDASVQIALALSPTIGSRIMRTWGLRVLYRFSICVLLACCVGAFLFLKESLSDSHRTRNSTSKKSWSDTFDLLWFRKIYDPLARRNARVFFVCTLLGTEFLMGIVPVFLLYTKSAFGWSAVETGYWVTSASTTRTLGFLVGFPTLLSYLSRKFNVYSTETDRVDATLVKVNLILLTVGFAIIASTPRKEIFVLGTIVEASSTIATPILRTNLLKHVPQGEAGSFMAGFGFANSLLAVVAPSAMLKLYGWSYSWYPRLPFAATAFFFFCLLVITFSLRPRH